MPETFVRGANNDHKGVVMLGELFDPEAEVLIRQRVRPHWSQAGAVVFVTFRTADSIPRDVIKRWGREKSNWLVRQGLPRDQHWSKLLPLLNTKQRIRFDREFDRTREDFLDTCQGRCLLKQRNLASIVANSLLHFDGTRYRMGDFVIMPNHVHLLASFADHDTMETQFDSWLHFTAFRIHQTIGEKGQFWQREPFDHLVRSQEQYEYLKEYIASNPKKSGLGPGEYYHRKYVD